MRQGRSRRGKPRVIWEDCVKREARKAGERETGRRRQDTEDGGKDYHMSRWKSCRQHLAPVMTKGKEEERYYMLFRITLLKTVLVMDSTYTSVNPLVFVGVIFCRSNSFSSFAISRYLPVPVHNALETPDGERKHIAKVRGISTKDFIHIRQIILYFSLHLSVCLSVCQC